MIWLSWRQQRLEAAIGGAVVTALTVLLVLTGRHIAAVYDHARLAAFALGQPQPSSCGDSVLRFSARFSNLLGLTSWFNMVPLLLGILVAAPIVLEFEHGTHRLAWTQTITRRRWLATRLTLAAVAAVAASLGFAVLMTWWRAPFDHLDGRFDVGAFDFEGAVPIAYTLFAAALVLAAGTILRRALPAVAVGIVGFLAVRVGTEGWVRYQNYLPPLHRTWPVGTSAPAGEATGYITDNGLTLPGSPKQIIDACHISMTDPRSIQSVAPCLRQHHVLQYAVYQPADRFWTFQAIETGLFLAMALALTAIAVWWVNHRLA